MANESWATKIQGGCTQKRRGKASERDMRISSWPARGGEPVVVAGFHSRQDLTDQPQLHYFTHSFTAIELGGEDDVKKKRVHLYRCVKRSKEMEMAWPHMDSFISGRGR